MTFVETIFEKVSNYLLRQSVMTPTNSSAFNNLIAVAQRASDMEVRNKAVRELWNVCGNQIVNVMAGRSYRMGADFSLYGCSLEEYQDNLQGEAYFLFYNAVSTFNPNFGVPFVAYVTQKSRWFLADEKRNNAKRSMREEVVDFSLECSYASEENPTTLRMMEIFKEITYENHFEDECYWKNAARIIQLAIRKNPKLDRYFTTSLELCKAGESYSDAEVAKCLGCTRARVGQYRKLLIQIVLQKDN